MQTMKIQWQTIQNAYNTMKNDFLHSQKINAKNTLKWYDSHFSTMLLHVPRMIK